MLTDPKRLTSPYDAARFVCVCVFCFSLLFFFFLLLYNFLARAAASEATELSKATLLNVNSGPERIELKEQALLRDLQQSSTVVSGQIRQA